MSLRKLQINTDLKKKKITKKNDDVTDLKQVYDLLRDPKMFFFGIRKINKMYTR